MNRNLLLAVALVIAGMSGMCPSATATLADYQIAVTNEASIISYYTFDPPTRSTSLDQITARFKARRSSARAWAVPVEVWSSMEAAE